MVMASSANAVYLHWARRGILLMKNLHERPGLWLLAAPGRSFSATMRKPGTAQAYAERSHSGERFSSCARGGHGLPAGDAPQGKELHRDQRRARTWRGRLRALVRLTREHHAASA